MSKEERFLKFENELNFGIETRDGAFYVPKDVAVKAASELLDELAQPQLAILKSIADELDDIFNGFVKEQESCDIWTLLYRAEEEDFEIGVRLEKLLPDENQVNIAVAYLSGKALGVDLVKVVEG